MLDKIKYIIKISLFCMVTRIIKIAMAPLCFHCIMLTQNVYENQNLKEVAQESASSISTQCHCLWGTHEVAGSDSNHASRILNSKCHSVLLSTWSLVSSLTERRLGFNLESHLRLPILSPTDYMSIDLNTQSSRNPQRPTKAR